MMLRVLPKLRAPLLFASFALLLLVGVARTSAAKPPLGRSGWAPGALGWGPSSSTVTLMLFAAYILGALAVGLGLLHPSTRDRGWTWPVVLALTALATGPFGSGDHTNYAAYGRIAVGGGDPYNVAPIAWRDGLDPVTAAVQAPWQHAPSIYGPLSTALQAIASWIGGANLRETVWIWQIFMVLSWLGVRQALRLVSDEPLVRRRIDLLWTFNPLAYGVFLLGAHVDLLATLFVIGAIAMARRSPLATGLFIGMALSTKITYGVVLLPVLYAWRAADQHGGTSALRGRVTRLAIGTVAVVIPMYAAAGPHVFRQLAHAGGSFSYASPWSPVIRVLRHVMPEWCVTTIVFLCAAAAMLAIASGIIRIVDYFDLASDLTDGITRTACVGTFALLTAYVIAAPYSLPWYDTPTWALLPLIGAFAWDAVLLVRHLFMTLAYVPGRAQGIAPDVETWTLGFRRNVTPWVCWLALAIFAFWEVGVTRARRPRLR